VFRGFRRGEDLGAEGPASPAGRGRHRSLRLQDRLPEDRGRGALSAHGATLCDGSERGHLPGSFSCLQPAGALGLGGPIEAGHPGHRDCRTLPPLFPGHAAHDGRMCAGLHR
ncbi:SnoaL-like domain-containing protein, partial [Dysosmobacter welbionis]